MKTQTVQFYATIALLTYLFIAMPMSAFAAEHDAAFDSTVLNSEGKVDHEALAHYYENQASEMQAKIEEQVEAISHKPSSSFFGKHGQNIRKHVEFKIHEYEKAAEESLKKAAYHKKMAKDQAYRPAFAASDKTKG